MQPIYYSRFHYHSITRSAAPVHRFHINNVRQAAAHADRLFYHQRHDVFPAHPFVVPLTKKAIENKNDPFLSGVYDKAKIIAQKWYVIKLAINTANNDRKAAINTIKKILGFPIAIPNNIHLQSIIPYLERRLFLLNNANEVDKIRLRADFTQPLPFFAPMTKIQEVMAQYEATDPPRNEVERSRNANINIGITMFTTIFENWHYFHNICNSDEDSTVKQTRLMAELAAPLHQEFDVTCNNLGTIISMLERIDPNKITSDWIIRLFDSTQPCLDARTMAFLFPDEPVLVQSKVDRKKNISFNLYLFGSAFAETFPDQANDALAFYQWAINQNGFIGAQVDDGMITIEDLLRFIADNSGYQHDFDEQSIDRVLARYGAAFTIQKTK